MKKMQCEVCGSTEIRKVSDDVFECQSCGIQYSKNDVQKLLVEITGNVQVDHSKEVENSIKRGDQYNEEGNTYKASEYYNKALDLDADNEIAKQRVSELYEKQKLDEYYVVEANIDPKENVKNFLKQLSSTENIACDIYKEINITNVQEKYFTFNFIKTEVDYHWSAISCHIYYENETVYKERYDANLKRTVKEPVTKQVEKVQRIPQSGTYNDSGAKLAYASNEISKQILLNNEEMKLKLLTSFESLQHDKYCEYKPYKLDLNKLKKENGIYYYNGYEMNLETERDVLYEKQGELIRKIAEHAHGAIPSKVGGNYYENLQIKSNVVDYSVVNICIPLQIIEYTYKGENYTAISDLISNTSTITKLYPCDEELSSAKADINADKEAKKKSKKMTTWAIVVGIVVTILGCFLINEVEELGFFLMISGFIAMIGMLIYGAILSKKEKNQLEEKTLNFKKTVFLPKMIALSDDYNQFVKIIDEGGSVDDALRSSMGKLNVEKTVMELGESGEFKEFTTYSEDASSLEDDILKEKKVLLKVQKRNNTIFLIAWILSLFILVIPSAFLIVAEQFIGVITTLLSIAITVFLIIKQNKTSSKTIAIQKELDELREDWLR